MFVRVKDRGNGKKSIQIVEAHRLADKVSQHIVRHVGQAFNKREVEELKRLAESIMIEMKNKRQPVLPTFSPEDIYNNKAKKRANVDYSPARARKDSTDRQRLIDRLMKKVKNGKIKIKDIIPNYGTKKYLQITGGEAVVNESRIDEDTKWDGLHGIITNIKKKPAEELLAHYSDLWQIEEAFRINKHDLRMRPIYHWISRRIEAHILICFIAYTIAKQATYRIRYQQLPMSFEQIRNELLHVQSSLVIDTKTKNNYLIPSRVTVNQKKIYQTFGLKRSEVPCKI